jgi:carboxypeptidase Q
MLAKTRFTSRTYTKFRSLWPFLICLTIPYVSGGCTGLQAAHLDRLIIGEVMQESELTENLRVLCLAGGRLSGTQNAFSAEHFVLDKASQYGLCNAHLESFPMSCWRSDETRAVRLTPDETPCHGAIALCGTMSTPPGGITAQVIDAANGNQQDFESLGDELRGRFALVRDGGHRRSEKLICALEHGAAGLIVVSAPNHAPIIGTGHHTPRPEPAIIISHEDGQAIAEQLAAGETVQLNIQIRAEFWDAEPDNVVAEIPGHGPHASEILLVGAHLDSWHLAEGAIDNGNGSATILECARALRAVGWRPCRTVRFVWFMGEEQDLCGSHAYVAAHQDELDRIVAMINIDMPGSPRKLSTSGPPQFVERLQEFRRSMPGYALNEDIGKLSGGWSDHAPFVEAGVCGVALWGELGPGVQNYHTVNDKFECVDQRATVQAAAVLAVLVRQLADDPSVEPGRCQPDEPPATAPAPSSAAQSKRLAGRR